MKSVFAFLFAFVSASSTQAQCPDISLETLQTLQRADGSLKESKIQDLGFDLHSDFVANGNTYRRYNKCWKGNTGNALYDQVILWNTKLDNIMFLQFNESPYRNLRDAIEGRHSSASAQKGQDYYIGNQFMYKYSVQRLDGMEYFAIAISFK